eukprot:g12289.t1
MADRYENDVQFVERMTEHNITMLDIQLRDIVAIHVIVKESRVELSVIAAAQSQRFRDLVQGQKLQNMPAPPTQQMLETFIEMMNHWETFAFGLTEAVRTEQPLPEVDVSQQIILSDALMEEMNHAMELKRERNDSIRIVRSME